MIWQQQNIAERAQALEPDPQGAQDLASRPSARCSTKRIRPTRSASQTPGLSDLADRGDCRRLPAGRPSSRWRAIMNFPERRIGMTRTLRRATGDVSSSASHTIEIHVHAAAGLSRRPGCSSVPGYLTNHGDERAPAGPLWPAVDQVRGRWNTPPAGKSGGSVHVISMVWLAELLTSPVARRSVQVMPIRGSGNSIRRAPRARGPAGRRRNPPRSAKSRDPASGCRSGRPDPLREHNRAAGARPRRSCAPCGSGSRPGPAAMSLLPNHEADTPDDAATASSAPQVLTSPRPRTTAQRRARRSVPFSMAGMARRLFV